MQYLNLQEHSVSMQHRRKWISKMIPNTKISQHVPWAFPQGNFLHNVSFTLSFDPKGRIWTGTRLTLGGSWVYRNMWIKNRWPTTTTWWTKQLQGLLNTLFRKVLHFPKGSFNNRPYQLPNLADCPLPTSILGQKLCNPITRHAIRRTATTLLQDWLMGEDLKNGW